MLTVLTLNKYAQTQNFMGAPCFDDRDLLISETIIKTKTDSIMKYLKNIPEFSTEHEVLNRDLFPGVFSKKVTDSLTRRGIYSAESVRHLGSADYRELDTNGIVQKYYRGFDFGPVVGRELLNPYVYIYKGYDSNDNLRTKGLRTIFSFDIGKWYYYDEKGNLTKVIDADEGYDFTVEDIINFCIKDGIDLDRKSYGYGYEASTEIKRYKTEKGPYWSIEYNPRGSILGNIVLNGKTGAVTYRKEIMLLFHH